MIFFILVLLCTFFAKAQLDGASNASSAVSIAQGSVSCIDDSVCRSGLICSDGFCSFCTDDAQCAASSEVLMCSTEINYVEGGRLCIHKSLFPVHWTDVLLSIALFLGAGLAAGAGLGGGGLFVPLLMLIGSFSARDSVPLSNACIVGLAVSNCILMGRQRHPRQNRPLMDFYLAALMQPAMLLGSVLGVLLNEMFADWLVLVLLVVILGFTTYRTTLKAKQIHRREKRAAAAAKEAAEKGDGSEEATTDDSKKEGSSGQLRHSSNVVELVAAEAFALGKKEVSVAVSRGQPSAYAARVAAASKESKTEAVHYVEPKKQSVKSAGRHKGRKAKRMATREGPEGKKGMRGPRATGEEPPFFAKRSSKKKGQSSRSASSRRRAPPPAAPIQLPMAPSFDGWLEERWERLKDAKRIERSPSRHSSYRVSHHSSLRSSHNNSRRPSTLSPASSHRHGSASPSPSKSAKAGTGSPTAASAVARVDDKTEDDELSGYSEEVKALLRKQSKVPWLLLLLLALLLAFLVVTSLFKGSSRGSSVVGVEPCSAGYWLLLISFLPVSALFIAGVVRYLVRDHEKKVTAGFPFDEKDVQWTSRKAIITAAVATTAGAMASLIGIGGGLITGPIMLELGVGSEITAATSSLMVLFTSLAGASQYIVLQRLSVDYGLWLCFVGFLSSLVGVNLLGYLIHKYKKKSLIAFVIVIVLVLSIVLLLIIGIMKIVEAVETDDTKRLSFRGVCD